MSVSRVRGVDQAPAFSLVDFLRRELAPTPRRLAATVRLTLACTAATVPIMIHHIPHGLVVMIVMYLLARDDTTATLLGSIVGLVGITLGFALALLAWQIVLPTAWRLAAAFLFGLMGLYLTRILVLGFVGTTFGLPAMLAMVLPDIFPVPNTEAMTTYVLWLWWCIALGLGINLGVQLLLSPGDPLVLLRRALVERLRTVERAVRSLDDPAARGPSLPSLTSLTVAGASEMLALLKTASLRHMWARQHHAELGALVSLVDQLVIAAAALEAARPTPLDGDTHARLTRVAATCAAAARALANPSAPLPDELSNPHPLPASRAAALPALTAMERVLGEIALAIPRRAASERGGPAPRPATKASMLVPDAFRNPEYLQFAVRGALACLICEVLFVGFNYPGIYTCMITCYVGSLSTVVASTQKGLLRFAGSAVGGAMGILALMYVFPHTETLGGFWAVFATGTAFAAWVNFGSPRVSYGGYQVGLAFYKVILQGFGPVTELTVARDRLVGIAFGLVVFGVLEHYLWPVRASDRRRQRVADVLRALAALMRLGAKARGAVGPDRELDDVRRAIAQGLSETQRLIEESKFELQRGEFDTFQRSVGDAQVIYLVLLSLTYQRRASAGLLPDLPDAARDLEDAVALHLERLADQPPTGAEQPPANLAAALEAAQASLASVQHRPAPDNTAIAVTRRLELYRTLVPLVSQLDPWQANRSSAHTIEGADRALADAEPRP